MQLDFGPILLGIASGPRRETGEEEHSDNKALSMSRKKRDIIS